MKLFRISLIFTAFFTLAACEPKSSVETGDAVAGDASGDTASGDTASGDLIQADTTVNDTAGSDAMGQDGGPDVASPASIYGTYSSNFGGYEEISAATWNEATIVQFDATARVAITQNAANDPYNPSQFSKIVWTVPNGGTLYYCTVAYGLASADLASSTTKTADDSAPDKSGCGGFSWTRLTSTAPIAIAGKYSDNFGGKPVISSRWWDTDWMQKFDNDKRYAIVQSPADDPYTPSKFSKYVWTVPLGGSFYFCTVDFGLDTADLAEATTKTADDSAPDKSGCGGFSWTKLTPQ